ncbi:MAG: NAD(+)/NADH kinase [Chloroflexota bacterium]
MTRKEPTIKSPGIVAVIAADDKVEAQSLAPTVVDWLTSRHVVVMDEDDLDGGHNVDAIIVLGGDGLMMHVAHTYPGVPLIGVNFGTVGFLAMAERSRWQEVLKRILDGDFSIQMGPTLHVTVANRGSQGDQACGLAVNDVAIRAGVRMIDTELYIDRQYVNTYPGDGMIVATPQGSTAYCMAAGGPILVPGVHGFAITPLSPHSPIRATLVVSEDNLIEMVITQNRDAQLILDGKVIRDLQRGDVIRVERGEPNFNMIMLPGMSFFESFRTKFNYLIRPEADPSLGLDRR